MNFGDMNLDYAFDTTEVEVNDTTTLTVKRWLPTEDKEHFIQFVVAMALDENTGCFSPLRLRIYFAIALCRWYADIKFSEEDMKNVRVVYDALCLNDVLTKIISAMVPREYDTIFKLVKETTDDIARYNNSAAGIINALSTKSDALNEQLEVATKTLQESKEAREALKNVIDLGKKG